MKVYLPAVLNHETGEVCTYPDGAFEEYVGAIHGLARQEDWLKSEKGGVWGEPIIVQLDVEPQEERE